MQTTESSRSFGLLSSAARTLWHLFPQSIRYSVGPTLFGGPPEPPLGGPPPCIDARESSDPITAILDSEEYKQSIEYFAEQRSASLLSPDAQALLYQAVFLTQPNNVIEIGAFHGGTTKALALACAMFRHHAGVVYAVEPFVSDKVKEARSEWPSALQRHSSIHPVNSMTFAQEHSNLRAGVILVDGNHDYEYALFDLIFSARSLVPGGFIFVDNISQPGPFLAAQDFLKLYPEFLVCGQPLNVDTVRSYDRDRCSIRNTDFLILRPAPFVTLGEKPRSFGERRHPTPSLRGATIDIIKCGDGTLYIEGILRAFQGPEQVELVTSAEKDLNGNVGEIFVEMPPVTLDGEFARISSEIWITWRGNGPLLLQRPPEAS